MDNHAFAPVLIPTLCRHAHFKRCVESLSRCTHADKTELIIALDYPTRQEHWDGYRKICDYIPTIAGFKQVTCLKRDTNLGIIRNSRTMADYAYERYDCIISSEDDNEFAPCFLDFMNKCLRIYADNPQVITVSGYTQMGYYGDSNNVIFTQDTSAWGFGRWKKKEMEYRRLSDSDRLKNMLRSWKDSIAVLKAYPACLQMYMNMVKRGENYGDTKFTVQNILNATYQVRPSKSMVRNWGNDGSGQHCKTVDSRFESQEILSADTFDVDANLPIAMSAHSIRAQFYVGLPKMKLLAWAKILKIAARYVFVRASLMLK